MALPPYIQRNNLPTPKGGGYASALLSPGAAPPSAISGTTPSIKGRQPQRLPPGLQPSTGQRTAMSPTAVTSSPGRQPIGKQLMGRQQTTTPTGSPPPNPFMGGNLLSTLQRQPLQSTPMGDIGKPRYLGAAKPNNDLSTFLKVMSMMLNQNGNRTTISS